MANFANLRVAADRAAARKIIQRNARLDGQTARAGLCGADAQGAVGACLNRHEHSVAEHGFADIRAGIIRDAAHHIEPRGHARDPHFATVEKSGKARWITVRLAQQVFKFRNFKWQCGHKI